MRQLLGSLALSLVVLLGASPTAWGAEARLLTLADIEGTGVPSDPGMGGTDFDGGVGDYLLRNDKVEAVILAVDVLPDFNAIPIVAEALPGRGILVDVGTRGDKNDQLSEIDHLVNLDQNIIFYGGTDLGLPPPSLSGSGTTASITVFGVVIFAGPPGGPGLIAQTTYSVTDGQSWIDIETTLTNTNPGQDFEVFSIADADITASRGRLPFQPFPDRGHKPPPLDLSNPEFSVGVWNYVTLAGNNGPADGPANNDGSPSGEVSYTFIPDSILTPLIGFGSDAVTVAGNNDPHLLTEGDSMTYTRKLVVAKGNSVEASLDIAQPLINVPVLGLDLRGTFTGRVVDGSANPVPGAHIFFDNIVPGAPSFVSFPVQFVTLQDENQDGSPDGLLPATPGDPLPATHVVTAADGTFTVKLQAQFGTIPSIYSARVQAPERGTVTVPGLVVSPINIPGPPFFGTPTNLGDIVLSNTGTLSYTVNDLGAGSTGPAKLTIVGTDGTNNPDFGSQYLSLRNYSGLSKNGGTDGKDPVTEGNSGQLSEVLVGTPALNFHVDADGVGDLELAPGSYIVFASRGLEYTIDAVPVTITAGVTSNASLGIERVVDTSGFVSMDFHIHSAKSFDSSVPITDRIVSFLAAGVDVMVSTDHDYITDYSPIITSLGAGDEIASIVGNEMTGGIPVPADPTQPSFPDPAFPEGIGHWNAWPLSVIEGNRRNGAPQDEFVTPGTAIDRLRGMDSLPLVGGGKTPDTATLFDWLPAIQAGQPGTPGALLPPDEEVVMLNHPRAGFAGTVVIGLFNGLQNPGGNPLVGGYDPTQPITASPNINLFTPSLYNKAVIENPAGTDTDALSFDAIELMNGSGVGAFLRVRDDWCSLLDQGIHKTATGVSDSHRLILENAGYARSFVASSTDDPAAIDEDELTDSVRDMQLTGTTGPFVRFSVEDDGLADVGLGGTAVATGEKVTLKIRVEAAPWIPVEEVRIYRNCELIETRAIKSSKVLGKVLRFNKALPIAGIDADSYFHVEAGVRLDAAGDPISTALLKTVQTIEPGVVPFAFTNPIFVDRDGGGYVPPPGL
jgi:hypothetical protein